MKRFLLLLCLTAATAAAGLRAQTVIELGPGGGVRPRRPSDDERRMAPVRTAADSAAWRDCLVRGFNALRTDSIDTAERLFTQALKLFPDAQAAAVVRHNLGRIAMSRADYRRAAQLLTEALHTNPSLHFARMDRATCRLEMGHTDEALADVATLLGSGQTDIPRQELLMLRAAIHTKRRLYADAHKDLEEVLALAPGNLPAALLLALTLEKEGRPKEAKERLSALLTQHPGVADLWVARANIEAALGQDAAARADYDEALRLDAGQAEVYVMRAEVLLRLDARQAARRDLDEARRRGVPPSALQELYRRAR